MIVEIRKAVKNSISSKSIKDMVVIVLHFLKVRNSEMSVAIIGDGEMRKINKVYRGKDKTTDVLSFNLSNSKSLLEGEILISWPQLKRQAHEYRTTLKQELARLLVHGITHLVGYDHELGERDRRKQERVEKKILDRLKNDKFGSG